MRPTRKVQKNLTIAPEAIANLEWLVSQTGNSAAAVVESALANDASQFHIAHGFSAGEKIELLKAKWQLRKLFNDIIFSREEIDEVLLGVLKVVDTWASSVGRETEYRTKLQVIANDLNHRLESGEWPPSVN